MSRGPGEHRDPLLGDARPLHPARRPEAGPIALLPAPADAFRAAVLDAGGTVGPLSPATRGLVWLDYHDPGGLGRVLDAHPAIGWVQLPWAGVDAFAAVLARNADRRLFTSAKGAYAEPVAEHALALTLAVLRFVPAKSRERRWQTDPVKRGTSLYGRHVLVVGAGGIAAEFLRLVRPFEVTSTVVRATPAPFPGADRTVPAAQLDSVLPDADAVVVAAAHTTGSAGLLGARQFALMRPRSVLVNVARGPLVDTDALVAALGQGAIAGAGIDVTDPEPLPPGHPLWTAPNTVVTMHSADTPEMTDPLLAGRIRWNVRAFLGDGRFAGVVDPAAGY